MAGNSNSGRPRTTDEEKKKRGTYRADRSSTAYAERDAEKIVTGVSFSEIPIPSMPLDNYGKATYQKWAKLLLEQGKLTSVTASHCETIAMIEMLINGRRTAGKLPTPDTLSTEK